MGYKIGLDFGTTNSTLSYIDSSGNLETFRYPGPAGSDYIPSCVAITKNKTNESVRIGREALRIAGNEDTEFYKDIKMILPRPQDEWKNLGWSGNKNPEEVINEYLKKFLLSDKRGDYSFKKEIGNIDGIVVSVPQAWMTRQPNHTARPKLEKIFKENLSLPLVQLISEPVAAAAYYSYWYKNHYKSAFQGNVLVCDMGGGTFDVTLCKLKGTKVEVLNNDGNGISDLGKAGVYFDTKLLQSAYKRSGDGSELEIGSSVFYELYKRLQEYKVDCAQFITENIQTALLHPAYSKRLPIIESPLVCYMYEIEEAFAEVKQGIETVLKRFLNIEKLAKDEASGKLKESDKTHIDAVIFVGGFNEFELTRHTIKSFLENNKKYISGEMNFIDEINSRMAAKAISFGATLIANDYVQVEEIYPHTIGIVLEWKAINSDKDKLRLVNKKSYIPLIKGKNKISKYKEPNFYNDYLLAFESHPRLTIFIKPGSGEKIAEKEIPKTIDISLPNFKPENRWKIGMKLDDSQIAYIVFEDELNKSYSKAYELGNILTEMFGLDGLILSKD
jgi:molecular chaperone DnaK